MNTFPIYANIVKNICFGQSNTLSGVTQATYTYELIFKSAVQLPVNMDVPESRK